MLRKWISDQYAFISTLPPRYKHAVELYHQFGIRFAIYKLCTSVVKDIPQFLSFFEPVTQLTEYMKTVDSLSHLVGIYTQETIFSVVHQLTIDIQYIITCSPATPCDLFMYSMNVDSYLYTESFQHTILPMANKPPLKNVNWYKIKVPKNTHLMCLFSLDMSQDKQFVEIVFPIGGTFETIVENNGITLVDYTYQPVELGTLIQTLVVYIRTTLAPTVIPKKLNFTRKTYADVASE